MQMVKKRTVRWGATLVVAAVCTVSASVGATAQGRPKAELVARAPGAPVAPGTRVTLTLEVRLPKDVHVQSDKPRDPTLIPTALTVTPPEGIAVESIRYPKASDLPQPDRAEPLAVFGPVFSIAVTARVAPTVAPGTITIPAKLRYQACDATTCFRPATGDTAWAVTVRDTASAR
jgi:DsbC/DsbD-like thiol-disulfide interchange protein